MESVEAFHVRVAQVRKRLGSSRFPAWYRGHADSAHQLLPGLLRRSNGARHERNLFANFKTQAASLTDIEVPSWQLLALMQHHGVPTRLLDWTDSLHTALFFALQGPVSTPVLWVLNPFELNRSATGQALIFDEADRVGFDYFDVVARRSWPLERPVALKVAWKNERLIQQRGSFTVHGTDPRPLDESCDGCAKRIAIPPQLVRALRAELERSGTDHFSLFPDLDGLARQLRARYSF